MQGGERESGTSAVNQTLCSESDRNKEGGEELLPRHVEALYVRLVLVSTQRMQQRVPFRLHKSSRSRRKLPIETFITYRHGIINLTEIISKSSFLLLLSGLLST